MSNDKQLIRTLKSSGYLKEITEKYFLGIKQSLDSGNKKIAWCTSVGPAELLYAMGFEVYFPENHAAMIGASKTADQYIPFAANAGYSSHVCSYMTSDIGAFLKNKTPLEKYGLHCVPKPDVLVFNTNQCHDVGDWFNFYGRYFKVPVLGIYTPLNIDQVTDETVQYVASQFRNLVEPLEKISGQRFDIDRYRETISLSKEACTLWKDILRTGQHIPSPINFFDGTIHMAPVVIMRGTKYPVDYYKTLKEELRLRIADGVSAVPEEKFRVYWDGMPMWFALSSLAKTFSRLGISIVSSTYCNSWIFDSLDPQNPFESSARAYTELFIVRSESIKEAKLQSLFEEFSVDGVIYHDSKTCLRNSNNHYGLPVRLKNKTNLPYVEITSDLNDPRLYNEDNTNIILETFVNQLASRGRNHV